MAKSKGPSRRMQKQGAPPTFDEIMAAKNPRQANGAPSKKRKPDHDLPKPKLPKSAKLDRPQQNGASSSASKKPKKTQTPAKPTKPQTLDDVLDSDGLDETDDFLDGIDDPDVMEDEFDTQEADRLAGMSSEGEDVVDDDDDDGSDIFDSEDDRPKTGGMWSDDDSDASDADDLAAANIEGMSRHLDEEAARQEADAQAELADAAIQTNIAGDSIPELDDDDDGASDDDAAAPRTRLAPDLQLLRTRITDTLRVLENFAAHAAASGRSRADYVKQLLKDISAYYGYAPFLAEKLFNLFPPSEAFAFFEANETARPVVIRANTLRTNRRSLAQALINRGVSLEPVGKWTKVGLQVFESAVPLGATPEYLAGHYMLQAASSFLPVMALAPQPGERVLDMAAAPGGKTTHMAALMRNTGAIFANDASRSRAKALIGNAHRLGARNTVVCAHDAASFPRVLGGFDRVLLDAPCSGTGVVAKDPTVKTSRTEADFVRLPERQKRLLLAAIDAALPGGRVVYSTCSVAVEENEAVVAYALARRANVRLVDTGLPIGRPGFTRFERARFPPAMSLARRFYPHVYNVDGFFVAKFKKTGATAPGAVHSATAPPAGAASVRKAAEEEADADAAAVVDVDGKNDEDGDGDAFGGFESDEDAAIMERARRSALRRKGLDPHADKSKAKGVRPKANGKVETNGTAAPKKKKGGGGA